MKKKSSIIKFITYILLFLIGAIFGIKSCDAAQDCEVKRCRSKIIRKYTEMEREDKHHDIEHYYFVLQPDIPNTKQYEQSATRMDYHKYNVGEYVVYKNIPYKKINLKCGHDHETAEGYALFILIGLGSLLFLKAVLAE